MDAFESRFYINGTIYSTYPVRWVDTPSMCRLLEAIDRLDKKRAFMVAVAISKENGQNDDEIETWYSQFSSEEIGGYVVMPRMAPRPAGPSRPYSHASGAMSNVYAPPTSLQRQGSEPTSHPRSVPPSTREYVNPYSPRSGSNPNSPGSYQGSAYGGSSDTYPTYGTAPPSDYLHGSVAVPYGSNQGQSYETDYPTSTHHPSSSSSQPRTKQ